MNAPKIITALLLALAFQITNAQTLHTLPFASEKNTIELAVANTSATTAGVCVQIADPPSWLKFESTQIDIGTVRPGEERPALFTFTVDPSAPVNKEQILAFKVLSKNSEVWTKQIAVVVAPPDHAELLQNFPNPFNPTTAVSYQLSAASHVTLRVYDMLGREVATLAEGRQEAGYHTATFNAAGLASGTYLYRLLATDEVRTHEVGRRMMILVK